MRSSIAALILSLTAACATGGRPPAGGWVDATAQGPAALVEAYVDWVLEEEPGRARSLGLHQADGRIAEIGPAASARRVERARAYLAEIDQIELTNLPDPLRLDLEITRLHAEQTIFFTTELELDRRILSYSDLFDVNGYIAREYAPLDARVAALLDHLEAATAAVDATLAMQLSAQPRTHLETAKKSLAGMHEFFDHDVRTAAQPVLQPGLALSTRFDRVIAAAHQGVDKMIAWIDGPGLKNANDDFAIGEKRFLELLRVNEGLRLGLPELRAMAQQDLERNQRAFVETARAIYPDLPPMQAAEKVAAEKLDFDRALKTAEQHLGELSAFIAANDVISLFQDQKATVKISPPFMRWNSAFLDMSGPFEKAPAAFYFISPPDPTWSKETQTAYLPFEADLFATSVHEVYPGHFVQGLHQNRAPTRAQKIFSSYAFVEGWAHYTEEMVFEAGLAKGDAKRRLGQLSNALLRNCRFVAALGLHTGGMKVAEANQLFREQCYIDPGNAEQQAYRGTFDPGYLSYTLGKLQIYELRKKFFERKKTQSFRAFHDWLLSFGAPPIALIEARL